jgi:hypothetical protein
MGKGTHLDCPCFHSISISTSGFQEFSPQKETIIRFDFHKTQLGSILLFSSSQITSVITGRPRFPCLWPRFLLDKSVLTLICLHLKPWIPEPIHCAYKTHDFSQEKCPHLSFVKASSSFSLIEIWLLPQAIAFIESDLFPSTPTNRWHGEGRQLVFLFYISAFISCFFLLHSTLQCFWICLLLQSQLPQMVMQGHTSPAQSFPT